MARRRSAWRTRLIADGVRAPVQPRGVLAKFEDLCAAEGERQAARTGPTDATVDGSRVSRRRAGACRCDRDEGSQSRFRPAVRPPGLLVQLVSGASWAALGARHGPAERHGRQHSRIPQSESNPTHRSRDFRSGLGHSVEPNSRVRQVSPYGCLPEARPASRAVRTGARATQRRPDAPPMPCAPGRGPPSACAAYAVPGLGRLTDGTVARRRVHACASGLASRSPNGTERSNSAAVA